jgi:hypothetical protein
MSKDKQDLFVEPNKKVSSVDWLHIELQKRFPKETYEMYNNNQLSYEEMIQQAKAMHKEEIEDSFGVGCQVEASRLIGYHKMAEQYYNEHYGNN